jgi:hypothetical protein
MKRVTHPKIVFGYQRQAQMRSPTHDAAHVVLITWLAEPLLTGTRELTITASRLFAALHTRCSTEENRQEHDPSSGGHHTCSSREPSSFLSTNWSSDHLVNSLLLLTFF